MALYMSGGVIPDRGYFHMRHVENGALIARQPVTRLGSGLRNNDERLALQAGW